MSSNSVIRMDDVVENSNPYKSSNRQYHMVYIATPNGKLIPCLLTEDDISKGIDRAGRNAEDITGLNLIQKLYHKLLNVLA